MTNNGDSDNICVRVEQLIAEYEQAREHDSTEIGRQFFELQRKMIENKDVLLCEVGEKPVNRSKNRYKDVLPYDKYRVILESDKNSDYINASIVEDLWGRRRYIAAQGPIEDSLTDFLCMIWEQQITSIVCTANEVEAGRSKFRRYWPEEEKFMQFGPYRVSKDETSDKGINARDFEVRPLTITLGENQRHVLLYHFFHWHDHDVPNDGAPVLDLIQQLYSDRNLSPDTPILVHCSAGCGRTGSFIAIDLCRLLINDPTLFSNKEYQIYPVFKIASYIRQYRIALIQTVKQYLFVHKMFVFIMKANGKVSPSLSIENNYENQTLHQSSITKQSPPSTKSSTLRRPSVPLQITLRNPPAGRRVQNGNASDTPSPTISPSNFFAPSSKLSSHDNGPSQSPPPPPIPPRTTASNATMKRLEGQWAPSGQTPIKAVRSTIRPRTIKRKDSGETIKPRSDSADALAVPLTLSNSQHYHHHEQQQQQNSRWYGLSGQEPVSD